MSSKEEAIRSAAELADEFGGETATNIAAEMAKLDNPGYRVAVLGKYQVGKSTLINKVFLGDEPILTTGKGLCTTAAVTEVAYGSERKMEVWERAENMGETLAQTVDAPTEDDVRKATAANGTGAERVALSEKVSRVCIYTPHDLLRKYTVIDTPGLDDPEPKLLVNTTFRVIPESDLAIAVVDCKGLDNVNKDLLRLSLVGQGVSKILILVSYKPKDEKTEAERKQILDSIRATVSEELGIDGAKVYMYCYDSNEAPEIFNKPEDIEKIISDFFDKNARPGREARIAARIRAELQKLLLTINTQIAMAKTSDEKRQEIEANFNEKVHELDEKSERVLNQIHMDIMDCKSGCIRKASNKVDELINDVCQSLDNASDFKAAQGIVSGMDKKLSHGVNETFNLLQEDLKGKIREILEHRSKDVSAVTGTFTEFLGDDIGIDKPAIANIPSWLVTIGDIEFANLLLPGNIIVGLFGRALADKFELLKTLSIANLLKGIMINQAKETVEELRGELKANFESALESNIETLYAKLKDSSDDEIASTVDAVRTGLPKNENVDMDALEHQKEQLETAIASLA